MSHSLGVSTDRSPITKTAEQQHGVVSLDQLRSAGVTDKTIRYRISTGEWTRTARRIFAIGGTPPSVGRSLWTAYLSRDRAVISGRSAAAIHRFDRSVHPTMPEMTVPFTNDGRSSVASITRSQFFNHLEISNVQGLPVTSPAETLFTVAQWFHPKRTERILDDLLLKNEAIIESIKYIYERGQGHRVRGMAVMRPLVLERLIEAFVPSESALEQLALEVFSHRDIPPFTKQLPLPWAPSAGRLDLCVQAWNLIIELDGRTWHARTEAFERDRDRDNAAVAAGYVVMRFTWKALTKTPYRAVDRVLAYGQVRNSPTSVHQPDV